MKKSISALALFFSLFAHAQEFPAPGYSDTTDNTMRSRFGKNIELQEEKAIEGIQVKLHLAKSAKQAIAKGAFLVKDPDYNQEKFNQFILASFEKSISYFKKISPGEEVKELNLVIVDQGGDKGTISEVTLHSRVIELHLVRWHKYYLKNSEHYVAVSSIHEFGHVINYMYSPNEVKFHREMSGVLTECLNLIQLFGLDWFNKAYIYYYTTTMTDLSQLLNSNYTNMNVVRNLAFTLFTNIYNGTYKGNAEARELTEKVIISYIKNPVDGDQGLNQAFAEFELVDADGKTLTLGTLQKDTQKMVCQKTEGCKL